MYKRMKKVSLKQMDVNLLFICDDLLKYNDDSMFAILKKYCETTGDEIKGEKIIISNTQLEKLHIPSEYKITDDGILTFFDDETVLATLIYSDICFTSSNNINNLYLDFDKKEEVEKAKNYKQ